MRHAFGWVEKRQLLGVLADLHRRFSKSGFHHDAWTTKGPQGLSDRLGEFGHVVCLDPKNVGLGRHHNRCGILSAALKPRITEPTLESVFTDSALQKSGYFPPVVFRWAP